MNIQKLTVIQGKYQWREKTFTRRTINIKKQTQSRKLRIRDRWNNNTSGEIFETEETMLKNKEDQN